MIGFLNAPLLSLVGGFVNMYIYIYIYIFFFISGGFVNQILVLN